MRRLVLIALAFCALCQPAAAAAIAQTDHLRVTLVADRKTIAPGGTVTLALVEDIIPDWHTYWKNPGDSGLAPTAAWTLPAGFSAGPILFPPPERLAFGPLVNFGYSNHTILLTDVAVPKTVMVGSTSTLAVHFKWLVCNETCIPEEAGLDISLPVAATAEDDVAQFEMFARARSELPKPYPHKAAFSIDPAGMMLSLEEEKPASALFFPYKSAVIDASAPQAVVQDRKGGFTLALPKGDLKLPDKSLDGVLEIVPENGTMHAYEVRAAFKASAGAGKAAALQPALGMLGAALLALAGGMILNLMPCVFPVLSFKLLALASHAHGSRPYAIVGSFAYTAGILVCFGILAGVLIVLKASGSAVGWGFQLQLPLFVMALVWLIFAMGLSLSGFFSIGGRFTGVGSSLAEKDGHVGSFFTGMLAAVVATPCSAPFMGAAIGYATTQPWPVAALVIECVGLGLALPYLALTLTPGLIAHLPRPGIWMETFKQFLAFPLYASAVWLIWVLSLQAGDSGVLAALTGCLLIAFAVWALHIAGRSAGLKRRFTQLLALASLLGVAYAGYSMNPVRQTHDPVIQAGWEPYTAARLAELRHDGDPVFVDMTAAWCIICMMNERVALRQPELDEMKRKGIVLLRGDWTNQNPEITSFLSGFGRDGVPIYVYYPPSDKPAIVLPQILTPDIVLDAIAAR